MTPQTATGRTTAATGEGVHRPGAEPWSDVVAGTLPLPQGRVEFVHPRESMDLLDERDAGGGAGAEDQEYPPYWAELWPSGVELAYAVAEEVRPGASVLELGCGLGLPGIAAALAGGRVLATDRSRDAIAFTRENARRSGADLATAQCSWTPGDRLVDGGPWDLVLGADVLYNRRNVEELLELLPQLVDDRTEVIVADPGRPQADEFVAAARNSWATVEVDDSRTPSVKLLRMWRRR